MRLHLKNSSVIILVDFALVFNLQKFNAVEKVKRLASLEITLSYHSNSISSLVGRYSSFGSKQHR